MRGQRISSGSISIQRCISVLPVEWMGESGSTNSLSDSTGTVAIMSSLRGQSPHMHFEKAPRQIRRHRSSGELRSQRIMQRLLSRLEPRDDERRTPTGRLRHGGPPLPVSPPASPGLRHRCPVVTMAGYVACCDATDGWYLFDCSLPAHHGIARRRSMETRAAAHLRHRGATGCAALRPAVGLVEQHEARSAGGAHPDPEAGGGCPTSSSRGERRQ